MIKYLPYPIGSRVLYKGGNFYIYNIHKYDGTYDLINVKGRVHCHMVEHSEIQMMFPAATACDWNKMLEALEA